MRFLVKVSIPVETGNALAGAGSLGTKMESILAELKPEAAYFFAESGKRAALLVVDFADASRIPSVVEPFFFAFDAAVEVYPAMTAEDLKKAEGDITNAAKKYG